MSRPRRTRVYNANYNIGESYYKPALDRLDRKYSGRPLETEKATSLPREISDRLDRALDEEDINTARRRAEKLISEESVFDSRGGITERGGARGISLAMDGADDIDDEIATSLKRIRANKKISSFVDDIDMEGTVSSITSKRSLGMSEKLLDSVGINDTSIRRIKNGDSQLKRRSMLADEELIAEAPAVARWTALRDEENSGAALRAKQSRARLQDLEDEMEALNERQAARERRGAHLRALVAENEENSSAQLRQSSMKSTKISARSEKKTVTF